MINMIGMIGDAHAEPSPDSARQLAKAPAERAPQGHLAKFLGRNPLLAALTGGSGQFL